LRWQFERNRASNFTNEERQDGIGPGVKLFPLDKMMMRRRRRKRRRGRRRQYPVYSPRLNKRSEVNLLNESGIFPVREFPKSCAMSADTEGREEVGGRRERNLELF
jgi:hypothetical protein